MANNYYSVQDAVLDSSTNILSIVYDFIPHLLGAILVFLVGLILGNWTKRLTVHALESIQIDKWIKKTQLKEFLEKAEFRTKLEEVIGSVLKWLVILIFSVAAINVLGLPTVSAILNNILAYIPRIVAAVFVLAIGVLLAGIVERLVKGAVAQFDVKAGRLLGKIASYLMVIFASMAAFNELGIARELINILFIGLVAMLALGFGLAIGLGAKDLVAEMLQDWYKKFQKDMKEGKK